MRYPGGKGSCFRHLVNLMPPHRVYIEPFLGGGNVYERKKLADVNIGVDLDEEVCKRWALYDGLALNVVHGCGIEFLRGYSFKGNELVYCDPPYMLDTRSRKKIYRYEMADAQHAELLDVLVKLPCFVIVSGYRSSLYTEFLQHRHKWRCFEYPNTTRRGRRIECAWFNFEPPQQFHDSTYAGDNFRERERIKRKRDRWRARLAKMGHAERQVVMEALLELAPSQPAIRDLLAVNDDAARLGILSPKTAMSPARDPIVEDGDDRSVIATDDGARAA